MPLDPQYAFLVSQAAHIESKIRLIKYSEIQYPELLGIDRSASPYADTITYFSSDGTGTMIDISNKGNDFPFVDESLAQHNVDVYWKGLAYGWSDQELGRAMLLGQSLSDRKTRIAFRVAEEEKERVALMGDSDKGWDSLLNAPSTQVTHVTAAKTWASANDEEIFNDVNNMIGGIYGTTKKVRIADTLLLPVAQFVLLSRPMGNDASKSIMEYIKKYNPYTAKTGRDLMIKAINELDGIGASNADRAVAYSRDMEVVRYHIPQELTFTEPQRVAVSWNYYGTMVLAGVEIMEPGAFRYLNGI